MAIGTLSGFVSQVSLEIGVTYLTCMEIMSHNEFGATGKLPYFTNNFELELELDTKTSVH